MGKDDIFIGLILGIFLAIPIFLFLSKPLPSTQTRLTTAQTSTKTYYENLEEWEVVRNVKTGRTEGVRVKRTASTA